MIAGAVIANDARTWVGTPWHHQASNRGVGTDCIGVVVGVARGRGLPEAHAFANDSKVRGYGPQPNPEILLAAADRYLDRIKISDAGLGDVFVMRFHGEPMHFAVVSRLDPMYIVHAVQMRGQVVENRVDGVWRSRILRAYRLRGVE